MKYLKIVDLARVLEVDYDFLQKYLKKESERFNSVFGKYDLNQFIELHTYPQSASNIPKEKIDVNLLAEGGVLSIPEAHEMLLKEGIHVHYTTVWRRIKSKNVTHIRIGAAIRVPIYILNREIEKGTFSRKKK
ncbi:MULTISPECIES: hypothetical protein [Bacillota]|uniref:hypothetical protein n=1 Tax=Bacillota TaxID=1239 RepID=UPI0039EF1694